MMVLERSQIIATILIQSALFFSLPLIWLQLRGDLSSLRILPNDPARSLILGMLVGLGIAALSIATDLLGLKNPFAEQIVGSLTTWDIVLLNILLIAPSEELFFRAFLIPRIGLVASSILFGLLHWFGYFNLVEVIGATVIGFVLGITYIRTGGLIAPIVAHALANIASMLYLRWFA